MGFHPRLSITLHRGPHRAFRFVPTKTSCKSSLLVVIEFVGRDNHTSVWRFIICVVAVGGSFKPLSYEGPVGRLIDRADLTGVRVRVGKENTPPKLFEDFTTSVSNQKRRSVLGCVRCTRSTHQAHSSVGIFFAANSSDIAAHRLAVSRSLQDY